MGHNKWVRFINLLGCHIDFSQQGDLSSRTGEVMKWLPINGVLIVSCFLFSVFRVHRIKIPKCPGLHWSRSTGCFGSTLSGSSVRVTLSRRGQSQSPAKPPNCSHTIRPCAAHAYQEEVLFPKSLCHPAHVFLCNVPAFPS